MGCWRAGGRVPSRSPKRPGAGQSRAELRDCKGEMGGMIRSRCGWSLGLVIKSHNFCETGKSKHINRTAE